MSFYEIVTIIQLVMTAIGIILVIIGWIIPYRQSQRINKKRSEFELKLKKIQWEKAYVDEQISELYGPMYEIMLEQNYRTQLIHYQLGRQHIFTEDMDELQKFSADERDIWKHFVDCYKLPNQKRILEIIQKNQHLFCDSEMPESYRDYLEYIIGWDLLDSQYKNNVKNHYDYHYRYNSPHEFEKYVEDTYKRLLKRQRELSFIEQGGSV